MATSIEARHYIRRREGPALELIKRGATAVPQASDPEAERGPTVGNRGSTGGGQRAVG